MKRKLIIVSILTLVAILIYFVVSKREPIQKQNFDKANKVVIAGRVLNSDPKKPFIEIYINKVGFDQKKITADLDSAGVFVGNFESYIPTDIWLLYTANFLVLTHPGDSIYVTFDGSKEDRPQILETIKFDGDAARTNKDAGIFQQMYYSSSLFPYANEETWKKQQIIIKSHNPKEYKQYMDSIRKECRKFYKKFVSQCSPNEETKSWVKFNLEINYLKELHTYSRIHFGSEIGAAPISYYNFFKKHPHINENILICGSALSSFTNFYHYGYVINNALSENKQYPPKSKLPDRYWDSIEVFGILKHTPDIYLRQMVLTEYFTQKMEAVKVEQFEKYKNILDEYITEPYLKEPLIERYNNIKQQIDNPKIYSDAVLKKIEGTSTKELMNKVLSENKGKVIYIDCWATWCAPCRGEMPNSKTLMTSLRERNVAFVFFCIDSEENDWKALLGSFQLGGQQYILDKVQSIDLRTTFSINSVPTYLLFDKNGMLVEKSSQLRPGNPITKQKILDLLDN